MCCFVALEIMNPSKVYRLTFANGITFQSDNQRNICGYQNRYDFGQNMLLQLVGWTLWYLLNQVCEISSSFFIFHQVTVFHCDPLQKLSLCEVNTSKEQCGRPLLIANHMDVDKECFSRCSCITNCIGRKDYTELHVFA